MCRKCSEGPTDRSCRQHHFLSHAHRGAMEKRGETYKFQHIHQKRKDHTPVKPPGDDGVPRELRPVEDVRGDEYAADDDHRHHRGYIYQLRDTFHEFLSIEMELKEHTPLFHPRFAVLPGAIDKNMSAMLAPTNNNPTRRSPLAVVRKCCTKES